MISRQHKRGATLGIGLVLLEDDGVTPVNLTGKTVTSSVRTIKDDDTDGDPLDELGVAVTSAINGAVEITAAAAVTAEWPLQKLLMDVRVTGSSVDICETITLVIVREETRA